MFDFFIHKFVKRENVTFKLLLMGLMHRLHDIPLSWYFYWPFGFPAKNRKRLKALNNKYKGKRCFVIANGPSLKDIDFSLLKDEFTFGMNRIYLMKETNGFEPSCLSCGDTKTLIKAFHKDLDSLTIPCFFCFLDRKYFSKKDNQYFFNSKFSLGFTKDMAGRMAPGKTITYTILQFAFAMGFSEVYIIGKDHTYQVQSKANEENTVKEEDQNHFAKNYFLPGQKFDAPDHVMEEYAYRIAKDEFEKNNRKIYNATVGGKLEVFERVDFYSLFK